MVLPAWSGCCESRGASIWVFTKMARFMWWHLQKCQSASPRACEKGRLSFSCTVAQLFTKPAGHKAYLHFFSKSNQTAIEDLCSRLEMTASKNHKLLVYRRCGKKQLAIKKSSDLIHKGLWVFTQQLGAFFMKHESFKEAHIPSEDQRHPQQLLRRILQSAVLFPQRLQK